MLTFLATHQIDFANIIREFEFALIHPGASRESIGSSQVLLLSRQEQGSPRPARGDLFFVSSCASVKTRRDLSASLLTL